MNLPNRNKEAIQKILQDLTVQLDSFTVMSSESPNIPKIGMPDESNLAKINSYLDYQSQAAEWCVIPFKASDNLVSRSIRKWNDGVLSQMATQLKGRPLLIDHNWDKVEDSVGFIYDAWMTHSSTCEESVWNQPGKSEKNKAIIAREGYKAVYCLAAVYDDMQSVIQGIKSRRLNDCSTGGYLSQMKMICPNCTAEKGRITTFTEVDKNDEYVCPHLIPSQYTEMYDTSHEDENYQSYMADYLELDGLFDGIELSIVQAGNLPAARVQR